MKALFTLCLLFASSATIANTTSLITQNIQTCSYWTSVRVEGRYVYACSSFPMSTRIPDTYELARVIRDYETRISDLEKRVQALEAR
jgi:hypothetical protein